MLLYTRRAPPKEPKKRSRAGCINCKEKKKKCDEGRPHCSRCAERGAECAYETVRPRQRKKRDSVVSGGMSPIIPKGHDPFRKFSLVSLESHDTDGSFWEDEDSERVLLSYLDDTFGTGLPDSTYSGIPLVAFSNVDFTGVSRNMTPTTIPVEGDDAEDVATEHSQESYGTVSIVPRSKALHSDLAMIAPCPVGSPLLNFCPSAFSEFSTRPNRRALVDHFCNVLSHLIVFREETGNPFQQLVLPLTQESSPVTNAIYALASAHLEYRGCQNTERSLYFHNRAIQGVAHLIEQNGNVNKNEILAAIMLLVYYEVLVQKGRSNIVAGHLKGALTIMCTNPEPSDPTSVFLERAFRFYDVIAALSNGTAPLSAPPTPGCLLPFPPLGAPAASPLCNVDTLLGMATTLWPVIHRLSNLLSLKTELESAVRGNAAAAKIAVLRTELETSAEAIEGALTRWEPLLPPNFSPDETVEEGRENKEPTIMRNLRGNICQDSPALSPTMTPTERGGMHSILNNALAYRHSAFVYLYRTIYGHPRSHVAVQAHAHISLTHCVSTVRHAGPMGALLWPLFVAACEAVSAEDRALAETAFELVTKRQGMRNIERAWAIVQEVWRRADLAELWNIGGHGKCAGADLWRQVSRDMGVNIVFG
ncbi:fungal-specific transcription factor domain-containing protein [Podospora didyma]|uniref:Fungal-specific transcription factor domain-containing protein n=1 Tax=Podospora didyma TaxID=330526 RepID=A0AAE0NRT3_9PEZI|nr:fungal-specific transcription factor domain-containing protein [Podospora didyma]